MFEFKIEIAGVPAEVKCRFRENMEFLRDYLTDKEPMSNSDAFPVLIKQAYMSREPGSMQRIMALEKALIDKVTFYKMSCNMEHDAAVMAYNKVFAR